MSAKENKKKKTPPRPKTQEELAKEEALAQKRRAYLEKAKAEDAARKEKEAKAQAKADAKEQKKIEDDNRKSKAGEDKRVANAKRAYNRDSYEEDKLEEAYQRDLARAQHVHRNTKRGITPEGEVEKVEALYAQKREKLAEKQGKKSGKGSKKAASAAEGKSRIALKERRMNCTLLSILVVLMLVCCYLFIPLDEKITQGLDIQGGLSVIMTAEAPGGGTPTSEDMDTTVAIITTRVNNLGASEATVQKQGDDSILVQIPGLEDADAALETIGSVGVLEFVDLNDITDDSLKSQIEEGTTGIELTEGTYTAFMTGESIDSVSVDKENETSSYYAVNLELNSEGTKAFAEVTQELVSTNGQIAIVLDGIVQSAPSVQSAITNGRVAITGNYTQDGAKAMKNVLESGSLPVELTFSESRVVGPTLGQDSLYAGLIAALVGLCLVALYLFIFYRGLGILTAGSIIVFAVFYLGVLAGLSALGLFALSLSGLAGIVLTIGMAADSSVLVLERFREEIRMGKSVRSASITGVRHGVLTSIDADVVTLVSAIALFLIAVGSVRGFGLTLAIGIVCDIVTMLIFKAPTLRLLAPGAIAKHPGFWGIKGDVKRGIEHNETSGAGTGVSFKENDEVLTMAESRAERKRIKEELKAREIAEYEKQLRADSAEQASKRRASKKKGGR